MTNLEIITACLQQITPASLQYDDWLKVGAAVKHEGGTVEIWDNWSRQDSRYRPGDCTSRWNNLDKGFSPVTVATIVKLCRDAGGTPPHDDAPQAFSAIAFDQTVPDPGKVVRKEWLEIEKCPLRSELSPCEQLAEYLRVLFQPEEHVGYVTHAYQSQPDQNGARAWVPKDSGIWSRTAGELLTSLNANPADLGAVIGDWPKECGAWIRFNPLDGQGASDRNVTAYRYALVESDESNLDEQYSIIRKLELPVAALVYSGKKSLHAICRIEASDYKEFQKRVDFLYEVCKKNGLPIDRKNRNPSRLSRLPGVTRGDKIQSLIATDIGKSSWQEWEDFIASQNDTLPDITSLADIWQNPPPLADELIEGVLRKGHKLLLSGPSKAGKSFLLMELACSIASGTDWLGLHCRQGRVLYVNLEIDHASFIHRLKEIYIARKMTSQGIENLDIWDLRGSSCPMNELAPKLIRRSLKKQYSAVIIDPIYKVLIGDENSAEQMAKFFNQFDKICRELKCSTIMVHHHSKGLQGNKFAQDRGSGSGVFARDPDALLDLTPLVIDDDRRQAIRDIFTCNGVIRLMRQYQVDYLADLTEDDLVTPKILLPYARRKMGDNKVDAVIKSMDEMGSKATGWRMEGILREFPEFSKRNLFFYYPLHIADQWDLLTDALVEGQIPTRKKQKSEPQREKPGKQQEIMMAYDTLSYPDKEVTVRDLADKLGVRPETVLKYPRRFPSLPITIEGNRVIRRPNPR